MRHKSFQLLGLRENATKSQVEEAYSKWVNRYKAGDYADDPIYVKMKLKELNEAYDEAMRIASGKMPVKKELATTYWDKEKAKSSKKKVTHNHIQQFKERSEKQEKSHSKKSKSKLDFEVFRNFKPNSNEKKNKKATVALISVLVVVSAIMSCIGGTMEIYDDYSNSVSEDYTSYEKAPRYLFEYSYYEDFSSISKTESDAKICDEGKAVSSVVYSMATEVTDIDYDYDEDISNDLEYELTRFTENYTGYDDIYTLADYIHEQYAEFYTNSSSSIEFQIGDVLSFYDFPEPTTMEGKINPYTDEVITDILGYLRFLNNYYENEIA